MTAPRFRAGGRTEIGPQRQANEDYLLIDLDLGLLAVFDAGGSWADGPSPAGPVSAEIIQHVLREGLGAEPDPREMIERAYRSVTARLSTRTEDADWGWHASVALSLFWADRVLISWLGDAMVHRVTGDRIEPLTRPHTYTNELIRLGRTAEAAAHPNFRYVLLHVLGGELPDPLEVISFAPQPGDRLVLTTDGVANHIPDSTILDTCRVISDPTTCAEAIIEHALMAGSRDNCTCAVIAFDRANAPP